MKIEVNGRHSAHFLRLGFQTAPDNIAADVRFKAKAWAPKNAKSYNIIAIEQNFDRVKNPGGWIDARPNGSGHFDVEYFTTETEGRVKLV